MSYSEKGRSYHIEAYGCQMNLYDGDLIASILDTSGYRPAREARDADVIVVNTCSVREHAEHRALGRIKEYAGLKRGRPDVRLVACGCMAQRLGGELLRQVQGVDLVIGTDQYESLPELLNHTWPQRRLTATHTCADQTYSRVLPRHKGGVCAFVAVMRGCDNRCAYCIVPQLRGPARSRPLEEILREVTELSAQGVREITLLGQNVNVYRDGPSLFPDLLQKVVEIEGIARVRFITSHPRDMSEDILRAVAASSKICEHLHLPLQSGSDRILEAMRRGYTAGEYRALVDRARDLIPDISITTDLIAGFPGETEDDFSQTIDMMTALEFDNAFTFQYSPRQGTSAAAMPGQVSSHVRHRRLKRLIDLQRQITHRVNQRLAGRTVQVLVEKTSKRDTRELMGRTGNHKAVVFPGESELIGKLVDVRVNSVPSGTAKGTLQPDSVEKSSLDQSIDRSHCSS